MNSLDPAIEDIQHELAAMHLSVPWPFPSQAAVESFRFYRTKLADEHAKHMANDPTAKRYDLELLCNSPPHVQTSFPLDDETAQLPPFHLPHPTPPNPNNKRLPLTRYGTRFFVVIKGRRPGIYSTKYVCVAA